MGMGMGNVPIMSFALRDQKLKYYCLEQETAGQAKFPPLKKKYFHFWEISNAIDLLRTSEL